MARRQLKSPRSLSGRSIHLTLVTKWSRSWSWMTYCHTLYAMPISPPILRYIYFQIWPWKSMVKVMCVVKGEGHVWPSNFKGQDYGQGQTHWSHLRPGVQSICFLFIPWQSDHFWLRYSKFHIRPWKSKVKVMAMYVTKSHLENGVISWDSECPFTVDMLIFNFRISVIENDFSILVNQPIYQYQKFELQIYLKIILINLYRKNHFVYWHQKLLISVIQLDFPISVNQLIYGYRKFEFFISVNRIYDTGKSFS